MDRYRYFIFNQSSVVVLGILQTACAGLCVVCGVMDAVFRKDTLLSTSRIPIWGGLILALPGVLALFASQRKNPILVCTMVVSAVFSWAAVVPICFYSSLTLTYGEENEDVFHQHDSPQVTFVLHRMVKGANATILLSCCVSIILSSLIAFTGCRSLPYCGCYDARTGLENMISGHILWIYVCAGICVIQETLVPQNDPYPDTELVCTWQAGSSDRLFNSPAQSNSTTEEHEATSKLPPYSRVA